MNYVVGKNPCKRCRSKGLDKSGDNFHYFGDGLGGHCYSCGYTVPSDERKRELGTDKYEYDDKEVMTKEIITAEEVDEVKGYTSIRGQNQRGITDDTYKAYGVRFKCDEETGEVAEVFYPYTENYKAAGFKVRKTPVKDFYSVGKIGKNSELFGQWKWKDARGKYVVITAGELDALSTFQMLENYRKGRGSDFDPTPVVSSAIGESGSYKQIQLQYAWLNQFDKIVVCYDNDVAGKEAVKKLFSVLPKNKMFVMQLSLKDANEYLNNNKEKQFINLFFNAEAYVPAGVVAAGQIYSEIVERSKVDKLPFPPMLKKLNSMLGGGINYGYIVNVLAGSGCGKSTWVNQCTAYWMKELDKKVLVVSLEAGADEFGENLLSFYMGKKIAMIEDRDEKIEFVGSEKAANAARELFLFPDGQPRLYLLDDRGDFNGLQDKIEECVTMHDIKIVLIDVISDVFAGMSIEQIDNWMKWEKNFVKATGAILLQVAHTRKAPSGAKDTGAGGKIDESMLIGSGTQYRSAGINIALERNKTHEDTLERNTTYVHLLKSRATGITGAAGELYYENETATLHDKSDWLEAQPQTF